MKLATINEEYPTDNQCSKRFSYSICNSNGYHNNQQKKYLNLYNRTSRVWGGGGVGGKESRLWYKNEN